MEILKKYNLTFADPKSSIELDPLSASLASALEDFYNLKRIDDIIEMAIKYLKLANSDDPYIFNELEDYYGGNAHEIHFDNEEASFSQLNDEFLVMSIVDCIILLKEYKLFRQHKFD